MAVVRIRFFEFSIYCISFVAKKKERKDLVPRGDATNTGQKADITISTEFLRDFEGDFIRKFIYKMEADSATKL